MKEKDLILKNIESVDKTIAVIKCLNTGRPVKLRGQEYNIAETINGGFQLVYKTQRYKTKKDFNDKTGEDYWLGVDVPLSYFSVMCNELTDEEITIMKANMALTEINKKSR